MFTLVCHPLPTEPAGYAALQQELLVRTATPAKQRVGQNQRQLTVFDSQSGFGSVLQACSSESTTAYIVDPTLPNCLPPRPLRPATLLYTLIRIFQRQISILRWHAAHRYHTLHLRRPCLILLRRLRRRRALTWKFSWVSYHTTLRRRCACSAITAGRIHSDGQVITWIKYTYITRTGRTSQTLGLNIG